ncbi:hypothetical protein V8E36_006181 [Tilletia maclaganii]
MSTSLLYTAISNRLAASSLGGNSSAQQTQNGEQQLSEWESISQVSDDELVDVASLPGTAPGTPRSVSRPSSPAPNGSTGRADESPTKGSSLTHTSVSSGASSKSKTDPLRSLPSEVSQRIFLRLGIPTLIQCSAVSRRWRRSATLNFCWFKYSQAFDPMEHADSFLTIPPPSALPSRAGSASGGGSSNGNSAEASSAATWTRRESRTDWKLTFAKQVRMARRDLERADELTGGGGSGYATPSRTERLAAEGVLTNTERRQQQWAEASAGQAGHTKAELREHYKSQGSRGGKVKGKSGKGGTKTGYDSIWD